MIRAAKRASVALIAVTVAAVLAGCTMSASITFAVDADKLADQAAVALQESVGALEPPNIDCGEEQIDVVLGDQVVCELSVDGDPLVLDTVITFTKVEGTDYSIDVQVAELPDGQE